MTQYHIVAPPQRTWNASKGEWETVPPYSAPHPIFGVIVKDGEAFTDDAGIAVEFADMGYTVEPNPKEDNRIQSTQPRERQKDQVKKAKVATGD